MASKSTVSFWDRFFAWLIDVIIVGAAAGIFFRDMWWGGSAILFIYWTILEFYRGQSIGKMVLKLKVVNKKGGQITIVESAIQSFGKAFILPIDVIIGWFFYPKGSRLFNGISNTSVIKLKK